MTTGEPVLKRLYGLKEAAVYLGISIWSIRRLIWNGFLPTVRKKGYKRVFVDVVDMDRYIEENKTLEPVQA